MDIFKKINHKNMKQERKRSLILIITIEDGKIIKDTTN